MSNFKVTFPGNKKVDVAFNNFKIKTDQSKENGGDGTAPEPFDIFISAMSACIGIYAKLFCETRKLSTDNMYVAVDVNKKEGQKLIDKINITLHVNQKFPEKYIKAVIKVMGSCSVKNQLNPDIKTDVSVAYLNQ